MLKMKLDKEIALQSKSNVGMGVIINDSEKVTQEFIENFDKIYRELAVHHRSNVREEEENRKLEQQMKAKQNVSNNQDDNFLRVTNEGGAVSARFTGSTSCHGDGDKEHCELCKAWVIAKKLHMDQWIVEYAPIHQNIIWDNFFSTSFVNRLKSFLINLLVFVLALTFVTPVYLIQMFGKQATFDESKMEGNFIKMSMYE